MTAPGGKVVLGSVDSPEEVGLVEQDGEFSFTYDRFTDFADTNLTGASSLDLSGEGGGNLQIQAENINLLDRSVIIANTTGSVNGGTLDVRAAKSFEIIGSQTTNDFPSGIFTHVSAERDRSG